MNEQELKAWDISAQTVLAEMKGNRNARKQAGRVRILIAEVRRLQALPLHPSLLGYHDVEEFYKEENEEG